jgi:hypothetical protein
VPGESSCSRRRWSAPAASGGVERNRIASVAGTAAAAQCERGTRLGQTAIITIAGLAAISGDRNAASSAASRVFAVFTCAYFT